MLRRLLDALLDCAVVSFALWTLLYCLGLATQWSLFPSGWLWLAATVALVVWQVAAAVRDPEAARRPARGPAAALPAPHGTCGAARRGPGRDRAGRGRRRRVVDGHLPPHLAGHGRGDRLPPALVLPRRPPRPGPGRARGRAARAGSATTSSCWRCSAALGRREPVRAPGRHRRPLLPQPLGVGRRARQRRDPRHHVQPRRCSTRRTAAACRSPRSSRSSAWSPT